MISGYPAMIAGGGNVKFGTVCVHIHSSATAPLLRNARNCLSGVGGGNKTSVILHCEFLIVLFIHPYRCFAAVIINVGNKCPPPQGGKQSCG